MQFFDSSKSSINQSLDLIDGHSIIIKREDLLHPVISGNKFRKLKYIFQDVIEKKIPLVITFGGPFSNHLAATASAGKALGVATIGIVRGAEWENQISNSTTLSYCMQQGMQLYCISRVAYTQKENAGEVQKILSKYQQFKLIPEGGTEPLAIKGCTEILNEKDNDFDTICTSVGTGGTLAGLIQAAGSNQKVIGFNALKNPEVEKVIRSHTKSDHWEINNQYSFGGYAKINLELIHFMNAFYQQYQIPLDPIYTGKMLFAIFDLVKAQRWKWGKRILIIHTGALQGIAGMNLQLQKKKLPLLSYTKDLY